MIWTLIRKNLRVQRSPVLAVVIVSVLCYVGVAGVTFMGRDEVTLAGRLHGLTRPQTLAWLLGSAATLGFVTACVTLPTLGGNAIALEKQERWADFEFMLPVPRRTRVLTKLGVAVGLAAAIFLIHGVLFGVACRLSWDLAARQLTAQHVDAADVARMAAVGPPAQLRFVFAVFCGTTCGFGVAWLMSALLRTAAMATAVGMGVALGLTALLLVVPQAAPAFDQVAWPGLLREYDAVMLPLGMAGLVVGTALMLRRRTPVS